MPTQGEILRDLRLERKMTMQELADYLKVSKQTINSWEKDFRKYDVETLFKLADFFNVSADYLVGASEERPFKKELKKLEAVEKLTENLTDEQFNKVIEFLISTKDLTEDEFINVLKFSKIFNGISSDDLENMVKFIKNIKKYVDISF